MPEMESTVPLVPFWALNLAQDVAAIKAQTARLPSIESQVDHLAKEAITRSDLVEIRTRVDTMWDAWHQDLGKRASQATREKWWRWAFGAAVSLLAITIAAYGSGTLHPRP